MKKSLQHFTLCLAVFASSSALAQEAQSTLTFNATSAFATALDNVLPEIQADEDIIVKSAAIGTGEGSTKVVITCVTRFFFPRAGGEPQPELQDCTAKFVDEIPSGVPVWTFIDLLKAASAQ